MMQLRLKKDKRVSVRGGNSHFLTVYCGTCGQNLALYQKDGQGALIRMYLDRIFEPQELHGLQFGCQNVKEIPNLTCQKCEALIGIPMIYKPEKRLAFRLLRGSFSKKKSDKEQ